MRLYLDIDSTKKTGVKTGGYTEMQLDKDSEIALNFTFDSLQNPIDYVSEFTYEVKIPRCQKNNVFFDHFYRLDNFITDTNFNPNKRLRYYVLSNHNDVISRGSAFLNYIDNDNYYVSLLGTLNEVFNKLLNSGWNSNRVDDENYYQIVDYLKFNGQNYTDNVILDRDVVTTSWRIDPQKTIFDITDLRNQYSHLADFIIGASNKNVYLSNIIGFAVENQGRYKDFESDKWLVNINTVNQPVNVLTDGLNPDEMYDVGDGLSEAEMREYRSYEQQPYIYIKRLFQIYQEECRAITGYTLKFDPSWYNSNNKRLNSLVYMLPKLKKDGEEEINKASNYNTTKVSVAFPTRANFDSQSQSVTGLKNSKVNFINSAITGVEDRIVEVHTELKDLGYQFNKIIHDNRGIQFNPKVTLTLRTQILDAMNDTVIGSGALPIMFVQNGHSVDEDYYRLTYQGLKKNNKDVIVVYYEWLNDKSDWKMIIPADAPKVVTRTILKPNQTIKVKNVMSYETNKYEKTPFFGGDGGASNDFYLNYMKDGVTCSMYGAFANEIYNVTSNRSYRHLTMEELFKEIEPFKLLLKTTKMLGMLWVVDDYAEKITVYNRETYFHDVLTRDDLNSKVPPTGDVIYRGVLDITQLIDYGKNYKISQPSWSDQILTLNFDRADGKYLSDYRKKYEMNYGSKKLITANEKNNSTYKLFCRNETDKINSPIISSEKLRRVDDIKTKVNEWYDGYNQIANLNNDGNSVGLWNNYYYRLNNSNFDDQIGFNYREGYVLVSDDYKEEIQHKIYCWHSTQNNEDVRVAVRPVFDSEIDGVSLQFGPVREVYNTKPLNIDTQYLYEKFFKNYIEQVYHYQSKKYEVYCHMNALLYRRLKINPLVQVQNTVFLCTNIEDWSENRESTRITLIQIQDLDQLTGYTLPAPDVELYAFDNNALITFDDNNKILTL